MGLTPSSLPHTMYRLIPSIQLEEHEQAKAKSSKPAADHPLDHSMWPHSYAISYGAQGRHISRYQPSVLALLFQRKV